jgi:hypothetical protein
LLFACQIHIHTPVKNLGVSLVNQPRLARVGFVERLLFNRHKVGCSRCVSVHMP